MGGNGVSMKLSQKDTSLRWLIFALSALVASIPGCERTTQPKAVVAETREPARLSPMPTSIPKGSLRKTDRTGDVLDRERNVTRDHPESDIEAVELVADQGTLHIRFMMHAPIPKDSGVGEFDLERKKDRRLWILDTWRLREDGTSDRLYQFRAFLVGRLWSGELFEFRPNEARDLPGTVEAKGRVLTIAVSLSKLPKLLAPFKWSTRAEWGYQQLAGGMGYDAGGDWYPDDGQSRIWFPESR
jgi:hypothetical protein